MITIDSDPYANPVYIGSLIIKLFQCSDTRILDVSRLYDLVNGFLELSFDLFLFSLDMLFVIGLIYMDVNGGVVYEAK
ncbi:hypothetical protein QM637_05780 [Pantoea allii]|uniref:ABC-three component system middle component 6 n=1 Tax=Pantoea allii TaxID=574096 RepID=UPI0024B85468|nr:ABC-three component system middle component 6 [Pantoea allii]MDJ0035344.1 hypothetical protein [Pantoea allii]